MYCVVCCEKKLDYTSVECRVSSVECRVSSVECRNYMAHFGFVKYLLQKADGKFICRICNPIILRHLFYLFAVLTILYEKAAFG